MGIAMRVGREIDIQSNRFRCVSPDLSGEGFDNFSERFAVRDGLGMSAQTGSHGNPADIQNDDRQIFSRSQVKLQQIVAQRLNARAEICFFDQLFHSEQDEGDRDTHPEADPNLPPALVPLRLHGLLGDSAGDRRVRLSLFLVPYSHEEDRVSAGQLLPTRVWRSRCARPSRQTPGSPLSMRELTGIISFLPRKFLLFQGAAYFQAGATVLN